MSPRGPQYVPKKSQRCLQDDPKMPLRCLQNVPKISPIYPKEVHNMSPRYPNMLPKGFLTCPPYVPEMPPISPKRSSGDPQYVLKVSQRWPQGYPKDAPKMSQKGSLRCHRYFPKDVSQDIITMSPWCSQYV